MRPQWGSSGDPDADPETAAAFRSLMDAVDDLRTARIRMENFDMQAFLDQPTEVTEEFMRVLAGVPGASPELVAYAARVANGECRWSEIEKLLQPLPAEVAEVRSSDRFIWTWSEPEPTTPTTYFRQTRTDPKTVGPSDWPDDFDDHPDQQRNWLV